jgi:hypothetical protein
MHQPQVVIKTNSVWCSWNFPGSPGEMHSSGNNFLAPTKPQVSSGKCDVFPIGSPLGALEVISTRTHRLQVH